jgi:hypothetical protein
MTKLIEPLEDLAEEGIKLSIRDTDEILVQESVGGEYVTIEPKDKSGVLGVCYVADHVRVQKSKLQYINSSGYGATQVAIIGKALYTIRHTKDAPGGGICDDASVKEVQEVSRRDYDDRLEGELEFAF